MKANVNSTGRLFGLPCISQSCWRYRLGRPPVTLRQLTVAMIAAASLVYLVVPRAYSEGSPATDAPRRLPIDSTAGNKDAAQFRLEEMQCKSNYFIGDDPSKWLTNVPAYSKVKCRDVYAGIDLIYHRSNGQLEYDFIDPVLGYATYFGSHTGADSIKGVAVDAAGNAYIVGTIFSSSLPTTPGALQPTSSSIDAFVAKLNAAGTAVEYVTYLGGGNADFGESIAIDAAGNAYVTGSTFSNDFPTTENAFQSKSPGVSAHPFVAKLNPTGTALVYSTHLGSGDPFDTSAAIAIDRDGQATVVGYTSSARFPVTPGAFQGSLNEDPDAFVARLNSAGSALVYATYLGGNSSDSASCIALDMEGNAYVAGTTFSTDFPTTRRAYQRERKGSDASFVAKLSAAGDRLAYSTLLGGDFQRVHGIAVDLNGNAYVIGNVSFPNVPTPTTPGALQPAPAGGVETFVMKLNDTGSDLVYSTFVGGSESDYGSAIAVDSFGQAYVTGRTFSADFPLARPLQSRKLGGPLFRSTDGGAKWDDVPALTFDIQSLIADPKVSSMLYASTFSDIIKSTDSGATWSLVKAGLSGSLVADPVTPATLYVFGGRSVHKSTDGGDGWKRIDLPIDLVAFIHTLVINPSRPDVLYLGTQPPTVVPNTADVEALELPRYVMFKSTDGGASWRPLESGLPFFRVSFLAIDPQMTSTIYAGADRDGLLKSTDGGASWFVPTAIGSLAASQLAIDPTNSLVLYASGLGGIKKSTDGGASWSQTPMPSVPTASITIDSQTPSTLYVGNFDGVYKTTDGGVSWRVTLDKVFVDSIALAPNERSTIYAPAHVTSDVFVSKLDATGTALVYSTFLGGSAEDLATSIAADAHGNAYIAGTTNSANLPVTTNAYQPSGARSTTGFVIRIADPTLPRITSAAIKGKKLLVAGEGFGQGAVITVNNTDLQTRNDGETPSILLISKRGGKQIARGQTVTIRVRNTDGTLSEGFTFTRKPGFDQEFNAQRGWPVERWIQFYPPGRMRGERESMKP